MRGTTKQIKPALDALLDANNLTFNQYCALKPKSLQEMIDKVIGSGERTVRHMLNVGPRNDIETSILNYYIWSVAAARIRAENSFSKLHRTKNNATNTKTDESIDFD